MRPFFPFYGSKWNVSRRYPRPEYDCVIEPFAGSAGYSTFYNCKNVILVDLDPVIAGLWKFLIEASEDDILSLPDLAAVGDSVDNYKIPDQAKWLIGFWLNRGSAVPKKSRTAYSARTDKAQLNWGPRAKERIASQLHYIRQWTIVNADYEILLNQSATWFVDPPYVEKGKYYKYSFSKHYELSQWCQERAGQVIVCEGQDADWLPFESIGSIKSSLGRAEERVCVMHNA